MTTKTLPVEEFYKVFIQPRLKAGIPVEFGDDYWFEFAEAFHAAATEARVKELKEALRDIVDEATGGQFCDLCGARDGNLHDTYCPIPKAESALSQEPMKKDSPIPERVAMPLDLISETIHSMFLPNLIMNRLKEIAEPERASYNYRHAKEVVETERAAMPEKPPRIQAFWDAQAEWSRATFGSDSERNHMGPLKHLAKEAVEAQVVPADPVEIADCLFLVFDAARRAGMTLDTLIKVAEQKLIVNKARKWQKPADGEAFAEHVREASHDSVVSPEKPQPIPHSAVDGIEEAMMTGHDSIGEAPASKKEK